MNPSVENEAISSDPRQAEPSTEDLLELEDLGQGEHDTGCSASAEALRLARAM